MIAYFSGTGNTRIVAQRVARLTQQMLYDLTQFDADEWVHHDFSEEEVVGLIFPVYGWGPPPLFLDLLNRMLEAWHNQEGGTAKPPYVFALCTCGDDIGKTMRVLEKHLATYDIKLNARISVQMPETYIALPYFKLDNPLTVENKQTRALQKISLACARINNKECFSDIVQGAVPWLKSYVLRPAFNKLIISGRYFKVRERCTGCGVCAKVCPFRNISISEGNPHWASRCCGCLSCYHHCPHNAIKCLASGNKGQYSPEESLQKLKV